MEVGDWITLSAVIVALGIGVTSILHTQSLQRKERKERILNEIIEWSVEINKCGSEVGLQVIPGLDEKHQKRIIRINWAFRYQVVDSKSNYIVSLAQAFEKETELYTTLKNVSDKVKELTKLLWIFSQSEGEKEKELSNEITEQEKSLQDISIKIIKKATMLKIQI